MRCGLRISVALFALMRLAGTAGGETNARRGAAVFEQQKCTLCHAVPGTGEKAVVPFEQRPGQDYTPAGMASRMWNHAPRMWDAIRAEGLELPRLTEAHAADLFAFFYAAHVFERRGDAVSGKQIFESKCARCHSGPAAGKPVHEWKLPADSVELVQRLWNHAPEMNKILKARKRIWPQITSQELSDLLTYVQGFPENRSTGHTFSLPTGTGGKLMLEAKGCTGCHRGYSALEGRLADRTLTEIAAAMWNHAPVMREKAEELTLEEMREILAYVWSTDFFRSRGNVLEGRKVFDSRCGICHTNPVIRAPDLKKINQPYTAITMVWALWSHGPKMLLEVKKQEQVWPQLSEAEMENLIAFLDFRLRNRGHIEDPGIDRIEPVPH
jgi:cytochrome c5